MRLVTRSDFDGLICAALLKEAGIVDSYKFVHPKDIQDGKVAISKEDVLANVPYWPGCGLWFDHHSSENFVKTLMTENYEGESRKADSCARIIYEYYGGEQKFPRFAKMIEEVDKSDSGRLTKEDIENPQGWILLSFIMDPRTGLGKYKSYSVSNYKLMESLIEYVRTMSIEEILSHKDVVERIDLYRRHQDKYIKMLRKRTVINENCIIIDLRDLEKPYIGNRFLEYALYPEQNISLRIMKGKEGTGVTVIAIGRSILNRTSSVNVGELCSLYGGGGHEAVGTCQVPDDKGDETLKKLVEEIIKTEREKS